jgi:hypothetical protein
MPVVPTVFCDIRGEKQVKDLNAHPFDIVA